MLYVQISIRSPTLSVSLLAVQYNLNAFYFLELREDFCCSVSCSKTKIKWMILTLIENALFALKPLFLQRMGSVDIFVCPTILFGILDINTIKISPSRTKTTKIQPVHIILTNPGRSKALKMPCYFCYEHVLSAWIGNRNWLQIICPITRTKYAVQDFLFTIT